MSSVMPVEPEEYRSVEAELLEDYDDDEDLVETLRREELLCPGCAHRPQEWSSGLCSQCVSGRYQRRPDYDEPKEKADA